MELDKSAASPGPTLIGSTLEFSRRRYTSSSRVSRLTNLHMIGFEPFVAFRAGTQWAMSISLIEMLGPIAPKMQAQSFVVSVPGSLDPVTAISGTKTSLTLKP